MPCSVREQSLDRLWPTLGALRRHCDASAAELPVLCRTAAGDWDLRAWAHTDDSPPIADASHAVLVPLAPNQEHRAKTWSAKNPDGSVTVWPESHGVRCNGVPDAESVAPNAHDPDFACLALYLPLLVGAAKARRAGELFVFAHVAQTLDGRIACANGHSQWISNHANLRHAHRARALLAAVMVGGNTALTDDPQLSVRHVDGPDPERIVLSGRASLLDGTRDLGLLRPPGCTVLCSEAHRPEQPIPNVDVVPLPAVDGCLEPATVRSALAQRGVHSVFLEGGGSTLSAFLGAGQIDLLHVHVAPIILGSGIRSFALPEVSTVQEGLRFETEHYIMDRELLVVARRQPTEADA